MEEGTFVEWLKRDGEVVKPGEPLFVLESDKAAENIEAIDGGILRIDRDSPKPGDVVKVGQVIAHLIAEGETAPASGVASAPRESTPASGVALAPRESPRGANATPLARTRHEKAVSPRA